jgi:soluble lytic murein transglycosylase-like protein
MVILKKLMSSGLHMRLAFRALVVALTLALLAAAPVPAEGPKPFADFSAKRVKPPKPGSTNRITIQIERQAAALAASAAPAAGGAARPGLYAPFWDAVSPALDDSGPGRLEPALLALGGTVAAPRLQDLQNLARAHGVTILKATLGTRVSPALVLAVISVESGGRVDAISSAGAGGLMQLMPDTATRFGVADRMLPEANIAGGVKYLDWLMGRFGRDPILVLAGYNAGEGAVDSHEGVPPYAETRDYVPKVLAAFQVARGLCLTPPELISDGCVFAGMN